jgi:hypothetical protein
LFLVCFLLFDFGFDSAFSVWLLNMLFWYCFINLVSWHRFLWIWFLNISILALAFDFGFRLSLFDFLLTLYFLTLAFWLWFLNSVSWLRSLTLVLRFLNWRDQLLKKNQKAKSRNTKSNHQSQKWTSKNKFHKTVFLNHSKKPN